MSTILRTPVLLVWLVLVGATALSWGLGVEHGFAADGQQVASLVILGIAFVKIRFIGLYFMELREAPVLLRGALEAYVAVVGALVLVLFGLA